MQHARRRAFRGFQPVTLLRVWRESTAYARLRGIDRAGLMWEWLRRDPDYIAWYAQASSITRGSADPRVWGLHFR
ncbi:transcriptional regulator domain-containing protein [Sphingobium sp. Cam5-1]|uniref:transcriptional regulator domain-containing protein n=1 Tax=Sphingobium sp. Cam5-1 TaxID=2789327 RepID=UPI003FA73233